MSYFATSTGKQTHSWATNIITRLLLLQRVTTTKAGTGDKPLNTHCPLSFGPERHLPCASLIQTKLHNCIKCSQEWKGARLCKSCA